MGARVFICVPLLCSHLDAYIGLDTSEVFQHAAPRLLAHDNLVALPVEAPHEGHMLASELPCCDHDDEHTAAAHK